MKNQLTTRRGNNRKPVYCIRCGKPLSPGEARYSADDPDCEEALCHSCYRRFEPSGSDRSEKIKRK